MYTMLNLRATLGIGLPINYVVEQKYCADSILNRRVLNQRLKYAKNLYRKDLYAHYGCVNAVEFSNDGEWLVSGGDDKRVLLWNVDKALSGSHRPRSMKGEHNSNIFCMSFDASHRKLLSAGNDEQVILHDVATGETSDVFLHDEAVYGLSVDPSNDNVFASACDDGRILVWDMRASSTDALHLAGYSSAFHGVMYNPVEPRLVATANSKEGVGLWDVRKPREVVIRYGSCLLNQSAMSVRFNSRGTHILALRRRMPPVLYDVTSIYACAEFDHQEYYNSCTMKSCCFVGDSDQYVLSGSDDFKLYMWKIPDNIATRSGQWVNRAHLALRGHRSIVNQVRYNQIYGIIASSGVEKIIKLWSTFPLNSQRDYDFFTDKDGIRKVYSHAEYINLVLESGQFMTHDYSHHSVKEDPRMMAFFDSLVQRDIEGWTSDSSKNSATEVTPPCYDVPSTSSSSSSLSSFPSSDEELDLSARRISIPLLKIKKHNESEDNSQLPESLSKITDNVSDDSSEETKLMTSDRISQLIVKKREEQMLKSSRASLKLYKHLKKIRHRIKAKKRQIEKKSYENAKKMLSSRIGRELSNKGKLLQRKRAKLLRISRHLDDSSDSDIPNETVTTPNETVTAPVTAEVDIKSYLDSLPGLIEKELSSQDENSTNSLLNGTLNGTSTSFSNGITSNFAISESNNAPVVNNLPQSSNAESCSSASVSFSSNNTVFFQPMSKRHSSRSYRKRKADDTQEDS